MGYGESEGVGRGVPVVGVDEVNPFAASAANALVHRVVHAAIGLARETDAIAVAAQDRRGAVGRSAVDDEVFDVGIGLPQNAVDRASDRLLGVEACGDDRN